MKRTASLWVAALVLVVSSACAARPAGSSAPSSEPSSSDAASPTPAPQGGIEHPTGDVPILTVSSEGGFVPLEWQMTSLPTFVLTGDGRVIIQGAQALIFPGPALTALQERTLTEQGIQEVLEAVEETNLFTSDLDLLGANTMVADASDTVFRLNAAGREVTIRVYALGMVGPDMGIPPGMSASEVEAHRLLTQLNDALTMIDTSVSDDGWESEGWQPYAPTAFRLFVRDVTGEPVEGGDMPEQVREWPTGDDPATFGEEMELFGNGTRCGVVDGEAGATWLADLTEANQLTLWTTDGENRFSVRARPLLPGDELACPDPAA